MKKPLKLGLLILCSYVILSLIATYPAWLHLSDAVIGPEEDNQQGYWTIWWFGQAIFENHVSPWFCPIMYHPYGSSLGLHDIGPAYALPGALISLVAGPVVSHNLLILLSFPLAALSAYLLAADMKLSVAAAWTAGVVFAFSPFLPIHAQHHLQLTGIHWFPLLVLALRRTRARGSWKWPGLAAIFFALSGLSSLYFAVFSAMLTVMILVWNSYADRDDLGELMKRVALLGLIVAALLLPRALQAITAMEEGGQYRLYGAVDHCSDLLGLIMPPSSHPLWGETFRQTHLTTTGSPWEFEYLGIAVLCVAFFGLRSSNRCSVLRWLILAGIFLIFSFGPLLHLSGNIISGRHLPYYWIIQKVPVLKGIRVPVRFTLLVSLGLAIAAASGVQELTGKTRKYSVAVVLGLLIFFDFLQAPFQMIPRPSAPAHRTILQKSGPGILLDAPVDEYFTRLKAQYLQTAHGSTTITGALGRDPGHVFAILDSIPRLAGLLSLRHPGTTSLSREEYRCDLDYLKEIGVKGLIFHRRRQPAFLEESRISQLRVLLGNPVYDDSLYVGWVLGIEE